MKTNPLFVLMRVILIAVLVTFAGFPIYWMATTALGTDTQLFNTGQVPYPQLSNLPDLFSALAEVPVLRWMSNTAIIAIGNTFLSLMLGSVLGYALSRFKFHGRGAIGFLMFMTQVIPEALLVVPLYAMFISLGLLNSLWGVILANVGFSLPVAAFILKGAIDAIPYEIGEPAIIDGCPRLGILSFIVLPLIAPSFAAAAVICFFGGWNEFLFAVTFLMDPDLRPAAVGLASFIGEYETPLSAVAGPPSRQPVRRPAPAGRAGPVAGARSLALPSGRAAVEP